MQETGAAQYPEGPPMTYRVVNGRAVKIGLGRPVRIWSGGMVLDVPTDNFGDAQGLELTRSNRLFLHENGRVWPLGPGSALARLADGTLVLSSTAGSGGSRGYFGSAASPARETVSVWRAGAFRSRRVLPEGWSSVLANARGDVLVRRTGAVVLPFSGDPSGVVSTGEADWTMGVLRGDRIAPYRFARPEETADLLRRETERFGEDGSVVFSAFLGERQARFIVDPR